MANFYSPSETVKNLYSLIITKLFYPRARLIRRPFYLRGNKKALNYGVGFTTGYRNRIEIFEEGKISVGNNCKFGDNVHIVCSKNVNFGEDCLLASNIFISDTNHGNMTEHPITPPDTRELSSKPISIGKSVWIGEGVCVLPGSEIGDGCILGAHSVVKGKIPPYTVVVGAPAKPVKQYCFESNQWKPYIKESENQ